MPLQWDDTGYSQETLLGSPKDGVRFTLIQQPTCSRRGQYKLMIEVLGGRHHHDWGCFDAADQPERYYHNLYCALAEAETIASVLLSDRLKINPIEE